MPALLGAGLTFGLLANLLEAGGTSSKAQLGRDQVAGEMVREVGRLQLTQDYADRLISDDFWRARRGGSPGYKPPPAPPAGLTKSQSLLFPVSLPPTTSPPGRADGDDESSSGGGGGSKGTYRTLCVRLCDGYYWPISYSTTSSNFARDAKACERSCSSPARLFKYDNPGEEPEAMEDLKGNRYKDLKVAFLYRSQYNEACTCKPHPWDEASRARHLAYGEAAAKKSSGASAGESVPGGKKARPGREAKSSQPAEVRAVTTRTASTGAMKPTSPAVAEVDLSEQSLAGRRSSRKAAAREQRLVPLSAIPKRIQAMPQSPRPPRATIIDAALPGPASGARLADVAGGASGASASASSLTDPAVTSVR